MRCSTTPALDDEQRHEVIGLVRAATAHDGVRPLSEQSLLDVRRASGGGASSHTLAHDDTGALVGYAHLESVPGDDHAPSHHAAEVVVHPEHRRRGAGRLLAGAVLDTDPATRFWSHGDLHEAHQLAQSLGLEVVRDLWQMALPLRGEWADLPPLEVPEGYRVRSFVPGVDEEAWLAVNTAAFATHAEQGRMTMADLLAREAEDWFDPSGFLLLEAADGQVAGFHWTKVEDPTAVPGAASPAVGTSAPGAEPDPTATGHIPTHGGSPSSGEVYVVGVDPAHQGRGLGRVVTLMGLHHLRERGLEEATLYVDGDNAAAIATYTRLGFERSAVDVMYARP